MKRSFLTSHLNEKRPLGNARTDKLLSGRKSHPKKPLGKGHRKETAARKKKAARKRLTERNNCPESAAERRNSSPDGKAGRKNQLSGEEIISRGMRERPSDISDFYEFFFLFVCVILFKILPSNSTRKSKFVCLFCGLTPKKKENILKSVNRYIAYRMNEQEAEHHGSEH